MVKIRIFLVAVFAALLSGCVSAPDSEGWGYSQKKEFLTILETDKYVSICNQQELYENVKKSKNSKLMTKMLVAYTNNLANSCIDLKSFKASQEIKKENKIDTYYAINHQVVSKSNIIMKLRSRQTIEEILKPYVPQSDQFFKLSQAYSALKVENNTSANVLHKIRLNIERTKLMEPIIDANYALINIPEFTVRIVEGNNTALQFAVIVGKPHMQTPIFSEQLQYVTINPQWGVPDSIARNEIIPNMLKKPNYLARKNMVIRKSYDLSSPEVNQDDVDWTPYIGGEEEVPYKFIEIPSNRNALGRVKFIFPNKHAVYMHDTQSKRLFKRQKRAFSHGCIRLEKPVSLLRHITTYYTNQNNETVKKWYDSLKTHHLKINKRLMVHTAYLTSYMNKSGKILMFNDVYGFDKSQKLNFE